MSDKKLHLGLGAGDLSLKVVLYDAEERAVVRAASLDLPAPALNDIATTEATLQAWLTEAGVEDLASISLTASSFRSIIKQVVVPNDVADVREYLTWYLSTLVNDPVRRYFLDFQILSEDKDVGKTVLFVALRNEWVDAARKGFRNRKLAPQLMNVDVVSMMNLVEVGLENPAELRCVVKADIAGVSIMWIQKDNLRCLRGVSTIELVGRDQMDAYQILSYGIADEIAKVKEHKSIETPKILLCGDVSTDTLFVDILKARMPETEVTLLDSFANIKLPENEAEAALMPLCVGALGVAVQAASVGGSV